MYKLLVALVLLANVSVVDYRIVEKRGVEPQVELRMSDGTSKRMDYIQFLHCPIDSVQLIIN